VAHRRRHEREDGVLVGDSHLHDPHGVDTRVVNAVIGERKPFFVVMRRFMRDMTALMTTTDGSMTLVKEHSHARIVDTDVRIDSMCAAKPSVTVHAALMSAMNARVSVTMWPMALKKIVSTAMNAT
jgi:hypothetical protein